MKWTVKLVAETPPGPITEHDLLTLERPDPLTLARLGLSLEETKRLLAALQHQLVAAQIERHGQLGLTCPQCGQPFRGRGSYPVTFHSLFGDVPVRVRRLKSCPCQGRTLDKKRIECIYTCVGTLIESVFAGSTVGRRDGATKSISNSSKPRL